GSDPKLEPRCHKRVPGMSATVLTGQQQAGQTRRSSRPRVTRPNGVLGSDPSTGPIGPGKPCRYRAAVGYTARPMSKVCAICGKKPGFGHNRSHSMVATKRRFNPNLQRVRVLLKGKATRAYVCTRCLKGGKVQKAV